MKIIAILAILFFAGCSAVPRNMQGTFTGAESDFVVIERDGAVYWSPISKSDGELVFVGIAAPKKNGLEVPLIVPSASTFFYSRITYKSDFGGLTFYWGQDIKGYAKNRSTEYIKIQNEK